ncbi:uncharacterized protein A1O9_09563 [Exophiala aquamarina CBS 119918]|uniref:Transcription factor domain-containing protein n=1 Tax=Exophiala aquamarina CBS 119918 TaxID=1182545 RepID=A0A072P3W2_9EURO|nr:uncharacterized protein A1O9_09563 [Exophiala aquamarina CBS 119918]KEF54397.1 hypothetical protein A1O9_09563 [Exophiala aquamarina CBS 119918]
MSNANPKKEDRTFTFVDYDINRRGVTETARAHLMKDRVRSKREARSEWVLRNQFSPLRWMRPKEENTEILDANTLPVRRAHSSESPRQATSSMSHYSAVIDSQRDPGLSTNSPDLEKLEASAIGTGVYRGKPRSLDSCEKIPTADLSKGPEGGFAGVGGSYSDSAKRKHSTSIDDDAGIENELDVNVEDHHLSTNSKNRREALKVDSEFGLSPLEGFKPGNTPPQKWVPLQKSPLETTGGRSSKLLSKLEASVERIPVHLLPSDRNLVRYFAANAGSLLGLEQLPEIEAKYDPVFNFFLPFACSSQWCFETMVLLGSAYHHKKRVRPSERGALYSENHYLAARQNVILAQTRSRISALANHCDSGDNDVVAFLFLAVSEYCFGDREAGRMHFRAWTDYCEMRRILGAPPCGLLCKIVVWWCVSMLIEDDVPLDSIIDSSTKARVREDPAKLFRYFMVTSGVDLEQTSTGDLVGRLD